MPAPEHLAARGDHGVLALAVLELRALLDRVKRNLGGAAKDGKHRGLVAEVDGVIAPFARHHHAAIGVQDALELEPVEADAGVARFRRAVRRAFCRCAPAEGPCVGGRFRTAQTYRLVDHRKEAWNFAGAAARGLAKPPLSDHDRLSKSHEIALLGPRARPFEGPSSSCRLVDMSSTGSLTQPPSPCR